MEPAKVHYSNDEITVVWQPAKRHLQCRFINPCTAPATASVPLVVHPRKKHPYTREKAVFPVHAVRENKFWSTVGRVDNAYGDRNLVCSCLPMEAYETVA